MNDSSGRYYFISDVHLGGIERLSDRKREQTLCRLLRRILIEAEEGKALGVFIVGDLFDSWFEFQTVIPRRHIRTLALLAFIAERIPVEYVMGNHDFGHDDFFESELGIPVHKEDISRVLHGNRFYISHGDGKALNDSAYLLLRSIMRNRLAQRLYRWIHPDVGIPFAEWMSGRSRKHTDSRTLLREQDGMKIYAERLLASENYQFVVMGHRHKPEIAKLEGGEYINLGDCIRHFTYGVYEGGREFRIEYYEGPDNVQTASMKAASKRISL